MEKKVSMSISDIGSDVGSIDSIPSIVIFVPIGASSASNTSILRVPFPASSGGPF
jgi:hypothetical protein